MARGISDNLFEISAKEMSEQRISNEELTPETIEIINRIVKELVAQTDIFVYDENTRQVTIEDYTHLLPEISAVTKRISKSYQVICSLILQATL